MALGIIAEWLARVERKLDIIIEFIGAGTQIYPPMHFGGQSCPVCKQFIDYQVDVTKNVVTRRCGCSTGKLPMTIPLTPVDPNGELNGNTTSNKPDGTSEEGTSSEFRNRR